jgi:hypothetical protein
MGKSQVTGAVTSNACDRQRWLAAVKYVLLFIQYNGLSVFAPDLKWLDWSKQTDKFDLAPSNANISPVVFGNLRVISTIDTFVSSYKDA